MTRAQFDSCRENRGMIDALNGIKERGRTLGIIGTPNFFVQGKLVKSVIGIKEIREMVDPILAGRVAASDRRRPVAQLSWLRRSAMPTVTGSRGAAHSRRPPCAGPLPSPHDNL